MALAREAAEYKDKLLRTLAEMENLRRRTEREVVDARQYGIAAFARDILAVADNMDRALAALDAELREKADAGVKALLDGVELTERELLKVLEKHGVKKFEPLGEKFDPNLHQAMYEVADPSVPAGTVASTVRVSSVTVNRQESSASTAATASRIAHASSTAIRRSSISSKVNCNRAARPAVAVTSTPAAAQPQRRQPGAASFPASQRPRSSARAAALR